MLTTRIFLKLHNWARTYKFLSQNIKKTLYVVMGQEMTFYSKLCNLKHFSIYTQILLFPQVAVNVVNMNAISLGP